MSIMRQMKDKAISMIEAMAERARSPQDIEAVRQRLVGEIQGGSVPAYVGVPLVQDLTKRLTEAKAQMAQQVAGMGVPQAPQGAPIAQQVMQQAQRPMGVEALPSNLPSQYAPGGLVAFAGGGNVERYANDGLVGGNRITEDMLKKAYEDWQEAKGPWYLPTPNSLAVKAAEDNYTKMLQQFQTQPNMSQPGAPIAATPAATPTAGNTPTATPTNTPPAAAPVAPPLQVGMPKVNLPAKTQLTNQPDLAQVQDDARKASEKLTKAKMEGLEAIDNPLFQAREERLEGREAAAEKDSAMNRALNLMSLGFGIAGSKERTLAGALGNEGRQGIADLIKGEAANRAAKERLEDLRDNLTQQRAAAKKGNTAAAEAAGQRASDDAYKYATLNSNAIYYGNSQALQRDQITQQGALGYAQIQATNAATNASLKLGQEKLGILKDQIAAGNKRAEAALGMAEQKAYAAFQNSPTYRQLQEQAKKMTPTEAQRFMHQEWLKYRADAVPSLLSNSDMGIPSFIEAFKATE